MHNIPEAICRFLQENFLLNLTACHQNELWAASCFYACGTQPDELIILTDKSTKHAVLMLNNPQIVGTIAPQRAEIRQIEGIQFCAEIRPLSGAEAENAYQRYCQRHPIAKQKRSDIWKISLRYIKYTSNKQQFAQKLEWCG